MRDFLYLITIKFIMYSKTVKNALAQLQFYFIQFHLTLPSILFNFFIQNPLVDSWNRRILSHSRPSRSNINSMIVNILPVLNRNRLIFTLEMPMKSEIFRSCCILVIIGILIKAIHLIFTSS